jgi:hypothetical protein
VDYDRIYEYFLGEFARTEGQKGGEFYSGPMVRLQRGGLREGATLALGATRPGTSRSTMWLLRSAEVWCSKAITDWAGAAAVSGCGGRSPDLVELCHC